MRRCDRRVQGDKRGSRADQVETGGGEVDDMLSQERSGPRRSRQSGIDAGRDFGGGDRLVLSDGTQMGVDGRTLRLHRLCVYLSTKLRGRDKAGQAFGDWGGDWPGRHHRLLTGI